MGYVAQDVPGAEQFLDWWELFSADFFAEIERRAQAWAVNAVTAAAEVFKQWRADNPQATLAVFDQVMEELEEMFTRSTSLPPDTGNMPFPQPPGGPGGGGRRMYAQNATHL
jgi:hypothetical protein